MKDEGKIILGVIISIFDYIFQREELNTWWQAIIGVNKVVEFDKHHCSAELKLFLDVENALTLDGVSKVGC